MVLYWVKAHCYIFFITKKVLLWTSVYMILSTNRVTLRPK